MVVLSFTGTYCRAFIWPFIQCPGIYYPISVLCETSQRDDRQTVAPFVNSGGKRRTKARKSILLDVFCAFVGVKLMNETLFVMFAICFILKNNERHSR